MEEKQPIGFLLFNEIRPFLLKLTDEERGRLFLAVVDYSIDKTLPKDFSGILEVIFMMIQLSMDRSKEKWSKTLKARSDAGKKSAAIRAAKIFPEEVSCEDISQMDSSSSADSSSTKSAELNTVELPSTKSTKRNPKSNPKRNPNSNRKSNPKSSPDPNSQPEPECSPGNRTPEDQEPSAPDRGGETTALEEFDRFWAAYPRKVGKQEARKVFLHLLSGTGRKTDGRSPPLPASDRLIAALEQQKHSQQWQRDSGRFIPYPATWLRQARWEDESAEAGPACDFYGVESL